MRPRHDVCGIMPVFPLRVPPGREATGLSQEIMDCPTCRRRTPVGRARCMYCGADLPIEKIEVAPPQRPIESHELAFNTILEPDRSRADGNARGSLASALGLDESEAAAFISASKRVPLARCQSRQEAELIAALVRTCGLKASVIADEDLRLDTPLVQARRIICDDGNLQVQRSTSSFVLPASELRLIVVGFVRNNRVDYSEGIAGSRGQAVNIKDSFEFQSDDVLVDVYAGSLERSFRVRAAAFDYSSLVKPLSFRAELNFRAAVNALNAVAPSARLDEDFSGMRRLLARAWPERSHTEARGIKRAGLALRPVAQSSVVNDNRDQFERYSRLMFLSTILSP